MGINTMSESDPYNFVFVKFYPPLPLIRLDELLVESGIPLENKIYLPKTTRRKGEISSLTLPLLAALRLAYNLPQNHRNFVFGPYLIEFYVSPLMEKTWGTLDNHPPYKKNLRLR